MVEIHIQPESRMTQRVTDTVVSHALDRLSRRSSGLLAALPGRRRGRCRCAGGRLFHQHQITRVSRTGRASEGSRFENGVQFVTVQIPAPERLNLRIGGKKGLARREGGWKSSVVWVGRASLEAEAAFMVRRVGPLWGAATEIMSAPAHRSYKRMYRIMLRLYEESDDGALWTRGGGQRPRFWQSVRWR